MPKVDKPFVIYVESQGGIAGYSLLLDGPWKSREAAVRFAERHGHQKYIVVDTRKVLEHCVPTPKPSAACGGCSAGCGCSTKPVQIRKVKKGRY